MVALVYWAMCSSTAAQHVAVLLAVLGFPLAGLVASRTDPPQSARLPILLLTLAALLVTARDPTLFAQPRFWAEEATVYFRTAWLSSTWRALIAPHQGYFSLFANLASIVASWVPLEQAPLVTTLLAALLPLVIVGAIAVSESPTLDSPLKKAAAALACLLAGATGEIWLTTINSQHCVPLLVFLILIDDKQKGWKRWAAQGLLVTLGLSSVAANFLAPLFLARYLQQRDKIDLKLFWLLVATSSIQIGAIAYSAIALGPSAYFHPSQSRVVSAADPVATLRRMLRYGLAYPLFGGHGTLSTLAPWWLLVVVVLGWRSIAALWAHWTALVLLTVLTVLGSLGMQGGERYAYPGAVLVSLMLIHMACDPRSRWPVRRLALLTWLASMLIWYLNFVPGLRQVRHPDWPKWTQEVKRWRADPTHAMQAHPIWAEQTRIGLIWALHPGVAVPAEAMSP